MTRGLALILASAALAPSALSYIRTTTNTGAALFRRDFANVQFFLNQNAAPGMMNSESNVMVTADSDINGALQAAMNTWNAVTTSAARFAPPQTTPNLNNPFDGTNTVVLADSPAIRSLLGNALTSLTLAAATSTGAILDTDIILNPTFTFSTTGAPNTFDLQAVLTKALGNSLGAGSSGVFGAALCVTVGMNSTVPRTLSPDDIAFANTVYPADPSNSPYGTLSGALTLNGAPLRNALISAVDPVAGTAFSTLTSPTDGTWSMPALPGSYMVYAQPLNGPVIPEFFGLPSNQAVDTKFQPGFLGGIGSPATVAVTVGDKTDASFSPGPDGGPTVNIFALQAVPVGAGTVSVTSLFPLGITAPTPVVSGQSLDIVMQGPGIDSSLSDSGILLLGPLTLRPGSIRQDPGFVVTFNGVPLPVIRFTVDIPPVTQQSYATLVIVNNGTFAAYTAGIVLMPQ